MTDKLPDCCQPDSDCADEIRKGNPPPCKAKEIQKAPVLTDYMIKAIVLSLEIDTGKTDGLSYKLLEEQRDADHTHYSRIIQGMKPDREAVIKAISNIVAESRQTSYTDGRYGHSGFTIGNMHYENLIADSILKLREEK